MSGVALAISGRGILVVDVVRHANGGLRVYLGMNRPPRRYFIAHPDTENAIEQAWRGTSRSHLILDKAALEGVPIFTETPA